MTVSLYSASVPAMLQCLEPMAGLFAKARAHCAEHGLDETELTGARLAPDMWPFNWQIRSCVLHSAGAIDALATGVCTPQQGEPPVGLDELEGLIAGAIAALRGVSAEAVDAAAGKDVVFAVGERRLPFTGADYVLSMALPNFYFHASVAYAILRQRGVPLGKGDFLGKLRLKA